MSGAALMAFTLSACFCHKPPQVAPRDESIAVQQDCPYEQCSDEYYGDTPRSGTYRGTYEWSFESGSFDDGSKCRYWLSGNLGPLWDAVKTTPNGPYSDGTALIEVEGTLTPPGCYGKDGIFRRELRVTKLVSFRITNLIPAQTW